MALGKRGAEQQELFNAPSAHNSMTAIGQWLPGTVFEAVLAKGLGVLESQGAAPRAPPAPASGF